MLGSGCGPAHVHLTPLPPNPDPAQRVALYQQYRPTAVITTALVNCIGSCQPETEGLVLGNGMKVQHPEDVLPLFSPDSSTARAASRLASAHRRQNLWTAAFIGGLSVGGGLSIDGHVNGNASEQVAGVALVVAALGCLVGDYVEGRGMRENQEAVYGNYDRDLARELRVCTRGFAIVPCEASGPPGPAPMIPDPSLGTLRQR